MQLNLCLSAIDSIEDFEILAPNDDCFLYTNPQDWPFAALLTKTSKASILSQEKIIIEVKRKKATLLDW